MTCVSENAAGAAEAAAGVNPLRYSSGDRAAKVSRVLSVQLKAWAPGYIPADSACAFILGE